MVSTGAQQAANPKTTVTSVLVILASSMCEVFPYCKFDATV